jgi:hypothetical protein
MAESVRCFCRLPRIFSASNEHRHANHGTLGTKEKLKRQKGCEQLSKLANIKINRQTPCPPRSAVPVNPAQGGSFSAAYATRPILRRVATCAQCQDHPIIPMIPEAEYLKGFAFEKVR